jgi:hypothetical protein
MWIAEYIMAYLTYWHYLNYMTLLYSVLGFAVYENCGDISTCAACTNTTRGGWTACTWCGGQCVHKSDAAIGKCRGETIYEYDDTCPIQFDDKDDYLANWMRETNAAIGDLSVLDLSLAGAHDTLTAHLSLITSNGGIDDNPGLAKILHDYNELVPDGIEDFIRQQAMSQGMNITNLLDNGVRFIDFRVMYEYSDPVPEWYSLHFLQTEHQAMFYMTGSCQCPECPTVNCISLTSLFLYMCAYVRTYVRMYEYIHLEVLQVFIYI